ncbi:MAG TPA: glycine cleavage system aminomethyltransferase GcvT [Anaerolineaceae bacterium]|nr:glycine cleavage system aminomethyltransferase GcvT [Anaerolineaceae bacterium]
MTDADDFLFRGQIEELDPYVAHLIEGEATRQARKLIMIPSESYAPQAVRQALGSVFNNVYAEGYPSVRAMHESEELLSDDAHQLAYYRRYSDRRFYKGVDFIDIIEALAARRAAQCFANENAPVESIRANVQALSGSAANLAIYDAFMKAGDTLMGLDLFQGGHLTHGSEFNISGKRYHVVSYGVDPHTEQLNYEHMLELALAHRPKVIVAGFTSYSWAPDWVQFRRIADACGAVLMADVAHTAGLVIGGVHPNPVGIADVTVFTTHKTLGGPRGAVILTTDEEKASKIDSAVFPGSQGGPHPNKFAAIAVACRLAKTEQFKHLQERTVANAEALSDAFMELGLKVVYGGTNTHIVVLNASAIPNSTGFPLRGEMAARLLDLAGIVVNKNTIPGDTRTALASGIRFGTPWVSQRGLVPEDMGRIAEVVHDVLTSIRPFAYQGLAGELPRGKLDLDVLNAAQRKVSALADRAGIDFKPAAGTVPDYFFEQNAPPAKGEQIFQITGFRARPFLQEICTSNLATMAPGKAQKTFMLDRVGVLIGEAAVVRLPTDSLGRDVFWLESKSAEAGRVKAWLHGLSDGYALFDDNDVFRKVQGPVVIKEIGTESAEPAEATARKALDAVGSLSVPAGLPGVELLEKYPDRFDLTKLYFVGQPCLLEAAKRKYSSGALPREWTWVEPVDSPLKRTALFETHKAMGGKIVPFAGWEMPVWYTGVSEEHAAVRQAAGLFDVSHMGAIEVSGPNALSMLDTVGSNYAAWLEDRQSCYGYLAGPDGKIIDDFMIYRRRADLFLLVVNASNEDKDWDWLNAVNEGRAVIDRTRPWVKVAAPAVLRNLKDPASGKDQLRDVALQGPAALAVLQACTDDPKTRFALGQVRRTDLVEVALGGIPVVAARTGYTGEEMGFELFVHPDQQVAFWNMLLEKGKPFGVKPCGLAARDSTRTEAGLPLYGHELAGPFEINPTEAGFQGYVKYHKPFFVGRDVLLEQDQKRKRELVRWRMDQKGVRRPGLQSPLVNKLGQVIGYVTSCSIDSEGFLLGLAIVDVRYAKEGTPLGIFVLPEKPLMEKQKPELGLGDKVLLHVEATVLRRFPERNKA